ncbi:hypothetical protein BU26DRAFT_588483 [Trematosphaeria pertusa]|uniref:Uncharacterized protein n=1 Tax=Trematosphaeria pertusa TaxID=390896 RepID=A0A6A6ITK3_9PLEO|nr:uncharacterized protein BU26DRAFT_588483 [Trematosphaeria pertusa]KAF2253478.1 hypothetical protein BU26DRAFT_588483 [Trematosphaeria pertusa]
MVDPDLLVVSDTCQPGSTGRVHLLSAWCHPQATRNFISLQPGLKPLRLKESWHKLRLNFSTQSEVDERVSTHPWIPAYATCHLPLPRSKHGWLALAFPPTSRLTNWPRKPGRKQTFLPASLAVTKAPKTTFRRSRWRDAPRSCSVACLKRRERSVHSCDSHKNINALANSEILQPLPAAHDSHSTCFHRWRLNVVLSLDATLDTSDLVFDLGLSLRVTQ